jgi:uncharacterized protein (TIGR02231 family)
MRLCLALVLLPFPALSDTIEAAGPVSAVTLYPQGATVTRTVTFTAPGPGLHEIIVPGLPPDTDPATLRVTAPAGVTIGTISLAADRPPAVSDQTSDAVRAAQAEVDRLDAILRDRRAAIAVIRARADAAAARAEFLRSLATEGGKDRLATAGVEELRALAVLVGEEVLAAREAAIRAEGEAAAAEIALQPDLRALAQARAALEALQAPQDDGDHAVLSLGIVAAAAGEIALDIDATAYEAGWSPVYDLRLTRNPDALTIARGVLVGQATGEDWRGVALTLSTARPSEQAAPSDLYPMLRQIYPEPPPVPEMMSDGFAGGAPAGMLREAAPEPTVVAEPTFNFDAGMLGAVFTYRFSAPVDIRSDADALRLTMDEVSAGVKVRAEAVPSRDSTAFLVAELTNATGQPLLPGPAMLYAEGAMVGGTDLPLIPDGGDATIGFGAIDGIVLSREVPDRSTGEEGVLSSSNRQEERAILKIENLTGQSWPLKVTDQVPYSEQDDLEIEWEADPMPATDSADGERGILTWELDLAPGETRTITLETYLAWPEGMVLQ